MKFIRSIIIGVVALLVTVILLYELVEWTVCRVYVPQDQALVIINKFGDPLPADHVVVPADDNRFKGVEEQVRGPGRYFINPIAYGTELVSQVEVSGGSPGDWKWDNDGNLVDPKTAPMIGLVSCKQGKLPPAGQGVVDEGYVGIQKKVLTPGVYKINPHLYEVTLYPAVVVPPGFVGVVTRLFGDEPGAATSASLSEIRAATSAPATSPAAPVAVSRLVSGDNQRGILSQVLQPGVYYLNPKLLKVTIAPVGYDQITLDHRDQTAVHFYSNDGYQVEADFTVVWSRSPGDVPNIVANIGDTKSVEENVINPAMKAACQNEGATYTAMELIQGATRSKFQDDLSQSLEKQVAARNIHVLLALIRNIAIKDNSGRDATTGLLATIQQANIEVERDLTNKQKTETATVKASLQQALKLVDVAKETVTAETTVKVADLLADGRKEAAEIDAKRDLDVAQVDLQIAKLDAQRTEIMGKATADVARMKQEAEAKGAKLMLDAFGSPQAYNLYTFAKNFDPTDVRMIFAGPGTFWTDLKSFQDVGASTLLKQASAPPATDSSPAAKQ